MTAPTVAARAVERAVSWAGSGTGGVRHAVSPDPGTARDWLREELSRSDYRESLLERVSRWFRDLLDGLQSAVGTSGGLGPLVGAVVLVLLVAVGAFLLSRLGANATVRDQSSAVFTDTRRSAAQHRDAARAALEQGRWDDAVLESVRALASGLFERGLAQEHADVTVHEIAVKAASLFPDHQGRLDAVAATFDETRYGDRPADESHAREAVSLEDDLARLLPSRSGADGPVAAVPR